MWQSPKAHLRAKEEHQEPRQGNQMEQLNPRKLVIHPKGNKYWILTTLLLLWQQQATASNPKNSQQKAFLLASDKKKPDPLVMKQAAFNANDNGDGALLVDHFGGKEKIRESLSKGRYVVGTCMGLN